MEVIDARKDELFIGLMIGQTTPCIGMRWSPSRWLDFAMDRGYMVALSRGCGKSTAIALMALDMARESTDIAICVRSWSMIEHMRRKLQALDHNYNKWSIAINTPSSWRMYRHDYVLFDERPPHHEEKHVEDMGGKCGGLYTPLDELA